MAEKYSIVYKYDNFFIFSSVDGPYLWGKNRDTDIENRLRTVLVRWMSLEPVKQSDVSQKEKKNYILVHIYGCYKNGTDDIKSYIYLF